MRTEGLTEFLSVARTGNFTRAAEALDLSVAHVSRQVAALERRLGTRLFERSTRSVQLTSAGERLRSRVEVIDDALEDALATTSAESHTLSGKIRIASLSGTFAEEVVTPTLLDLVDQYPMLDIEIDFEVRHVDLIREGYDLAIRSGPMRESELVALPLARRRFVAAASPCYLAKFAAPKHPSELINHSCIRVRDDQWIFDDQGSTLAVPIKSRIKLNTGPALAEACRRGLGIAYMASTGFETLFAAGQILPVLQPFWRTEMSIYAVRAHRSYVPARVRLIMERLQQAASDFEHRDEKWVSQLK